MNDPSKAPPREITIALGDTVQHFMDSNKLPSEEGRTDTPDTDNYGIALDVIADTDPIVFGDHWVRLTVKQGKESIKLPAGRTLFIDQVAGQIRSVTFTPFDKPHSLDETNRLSRKLLDEFLAKGWTPKIANSITFALTERDADLKERGSKIYAQLKDEVDNLLSFTVSELSKIPSNPSYLLAPARKREAPEIPVYVIQIGFYWVKRNEISYGDLVYPRRLFVHGNARIPLKLRSWVADPGWTPEKNGMINFGGKGEKRQWALPKR